MAKSEMNDNNAPAPVARQYGFANRPNDHQTDFRRRTDHYRATQMRRIELDRDMQYVLNRDEILRTRGLDPLMDAAKYEEQRRRELIEARYAANLLKRVEESIGFIPEKADSPNGARVEKLLETKSVPEVIDMFIEKYQPDDYPPVFLEFVEQDPDDETMQKLAEAFEAEYRGLMLDFLKWHADKVTRKALIGYARANISDETFNRMFASQTTPKSEL